MRGLGVEDMGEVDQEEALDWIGLCMEVGVVSLRRWIAVTDFISFVYLV
jgi:hypothetical protein